MDKKDTKDKRIEEFVHKFNNIMVGIVGNGRLLADSNLVKPKGVKLLDSLLKSADEAVSLARRLVRNESLANPVSIDKSISSKGDSFNIANQDLLDVKEHDLFTVLVIDDQEIVRSVSRTILEKAGYDVLTTATGQQGIELYKKHQCHINCVVLDINMPDMDGTIVLEKLKEIQPEVSVLLMSGYHIESLASQYDIEGICGCIQKPFQKEDLLNAIRSVQTDYVDSDEAIAN